MEVPNNYPLKAKHSLIYEQFSSWWSFLNTVGIFAFLLFLACLGAGGDKYFCAVLCVSVIAWILVVGRRNFPEFSKKLRKSSDPKDKEFDKELWQEQFPLFKVPLTHWPYWLGMVSLLILSLAPFVTPMDLSLYAPTSFRIQI